MSASINTKIVNTERYDGPVNHMETVGREIVSDMATLLILLKTRIATGIQSSRPRERNIY